jgi:hypothetical protein
MDPFLKLLLKQKKADNILPLLIIQILHMLKMHGERNLHNILVQELKAKGYKINY